MRIRALPHFRKLIGAGALFAMGFAAPVPAAPPASAPTTTVPAATNVPTPIAAAPTPNSPTTAPPSTAPAGASMDLRRLDDQTQCLYAELQRGVARVRLPMPLWLAEVAERDNPLRKWQGRLDADMRRQLEDESLADAAHRHLVTVTPAGRGPTAQSTHPADNARVFRVIVPANHMLVLRGPDGSRQIVIVGPVGPRDLAGDAMVAPGGIEQVALLLDDDGYLLAPIYVEAEAFAGRDIPVEIDHATLPARFVASDRLANITILRLTRPVGAPPALRPGRPAEGSLVMVIDPNARRPQLTFWTDAGDLHGLVASVDGSAIGFARQGQFVDPAGCRAMIDQLIHTGHVRRAILGLVVRASGGEAAPVELRRMGLCDAPRVERVIDASAAANAGILPGDWLVSLGGTPLDDPIALAAILAEKRGTAPLVVLREGRLLTLHIELTEPPIQ